MDVSLGSLRRRLLAMRAWDSQGKSLDYKIDSAVNQALDRLAGDVPEALMPDEEHIVLKRPYKSGDDNVDAYVRVHPTDKRLLEFVDKNGVPIDDFRSATRWRPNITGEWDGIMHIECTDPRGQVHRRQCREFFGYVPHFAVPKADFSVVSKSRGLVVGSVTPASLDAESKEIDKVSINAAEKYLSETVLARNPNQNRAQAVAQYLNQFGVSGAAALRVSNPQEAQRKILLAKENGLNVRDITEEFLESFRVGLRSGGARFRSFKANGKVLLQTALPGAATSSVDSSITANTSSMADLVEFDFDPAILIKDYTTGGSAELLSATVKLTPEIKAGGVLPLPVERKHRKLVGYRPYMITLDRPWPNNVDGWTFRIREIPARVVEGLKIGGREVKVLAAGEPMEFRIYQPEFFMRDDVTEVHEPAVIFDETEQQVWAIDTAGADRAGMRDHRGDMEGRPVRLFRGRHFQLPAPTEAPKLEYSPIAPWVYGDVSSPESLKRGTFKICYTYVWGRRDKEWQQAPNVAPTGHRGLNSLVNLNWAHSMNDYTLIPNSDVVGNAGITDPTWESAPSPVSTITVRKKGANHGLVIQGTNIDAMMGFSNPFTLRFGRTGLRLRFYVSYTGYSDDAVGDMENIETNDRFYLLCEVEPTFDQIMRNHAQACRFVWSGAELFDIERPLRHSTGYYAYKTYPSHDARYELDFRVSRLPKQLIDDQDTPPIQRDAIPALMELATYYVALLDGADQGGAQIHLDRYIELARRYRSRYANPARIVEPTSIIGGTPYRSRFNLFGNFKS